MRIIQHREWREHIEYSRFFEYDDMSGAGFAFDCDAQGNVDTAKLNPCARDSYAKCLTGAMEVTRGVEFAVNRDPATCERDPWVPVPGSGTRVTVKMHDRGVQERDLSGWEPAIGQCSCGEQVYLDRFTNTCHGCGADYNSAGQRLADRSQWGEETGESAADILAVDGMSEEDCFSGDY